MDAQFDDIERKDEHEMPLICERDIYRKVDTVGHRLSGQRVGTGVLTTIGAVGGEPGTDSCW